MVQAKRFHLPEVVFNDPGLPMVLQHVQSGLLVLHLAECVFIDDVVVPCIFEDARRYPWLDQFE